MIVTLVKRNGIPISVGVESHCFDLKNDQVCDNTAQRTGSELRGATSLAKYTEAFDLAKLAWEIQSFDTVEEH